MAGSTDHCEIAPKRSGAVPVRWKVFQTLVFGITSVSGYSCAILFGYWLQGLDAHCPLFAEFKFVQSSDENGTSVRPLQLDFSTSKWGRDALCSFCQFVPILTAVYAFIWGGFFACCGRGGRSSDGVEPWKLVFAAMAFSALYLPVALTASAFTTSGIEETCAHLKYYLVEINYVKEAAEITAWVSAGGWALAGLLLLMRYLCLADWDLVQRSPDQTRICGNLVEEEEAIET
ncbi:hypothetical protein B566_EDAN005040 [Ephemera danica]|nr:hypothetical protein B566_EDAN005040 [Ephemera danica]